MRAPLYDKDTQITDSQLRPEWEKISVLTSEKKIVVQIFKNSHSPRQLGKECEREGETRMVRAYKVRLPQSGQSQSILISKETI